MDNNRPGPSRINPNDEKFEEVVTRWYEQCDSDSDVDPDFEIQSEHESESEQSLDEDETADPKLEDTPTNYFVGKNNFRWCANQPPQNVRTRKHNIVMHLPGLRNPAKTLGNNPDILDVWRLIFNGAMVQELVQWTNEKIVKMRETYSASDASFLGETNVLEIEAFLGLLIYSEVFKSNHESIESLFATDGTGRDVFRSTMSQKRFLFLLSCLRFDNAQTREERKQSNPAAAIAMIFNTLIENSQKNYTVGTSVCIDEMLVPFRGRCKFRMYMPLKPTKYGIKVLCMTDARNNYFYDGYIYCGKGSDGLTLSDEERTFSIPTQAVLRLTRSIVKTNRNVTADNWFSSIELVNELRQRGLTFVGTLKKNKREVPSAFLPKKSRPVKSCLYGFTDNMTLLSFVQKASKCVLVISSMHHGTATDPATDKPEMIAFYNSTKGGVDSLDQKCANYSCNRRTRRWPMAVFFALLNISTVNAYVLHQSYRDAQYITRLNFLKALARSLTEPYMKVRLTGANLQKELRFTISRVLKVEVNEEENPEVDVLERRGTCYLCDWRLKRRTKYLCCACKKPICLQCSKKICKRCTK